MGAKWRRGKQQMHRPNKKMVVQQSKSNQQMGQINEDVVMW
jgi:hypothetical protein